MKIIRTVAGNGTGGSSGNGGQATAAQIGFPMGVVVDKAGNLYVADLINRVVRKINPAGIITTAITGLDYPSGLAVDANDNIYVADRDHNCIKKLSGGVVSIVAGGGGGLLGDGGPATNAGLNVPTGVAVDKWGNIYIADFVNSRVRKVNGTTGIITTVAGDGTKGYNGDGGPATAAKLYWPTGVAVDTAGDVYITDGTNQVIRKIIVSTGYIYKFAGQATPGGYGTAGFSGDGGPATAATFCYPNACAADRYGNVYIADHANNRIRKVNAAGIITTFAGNGRAGYTAYGPSSPGGYYGDGGPVDSSELYDPVDVTVDALGNPYISDAANHVIRKVSAGNDIWFTGGSAQYFYPCQNTTTPLNVQLSITDTTPGETVIWSLAAAPKHGTVAASYTTTSTGGVLTPTGLDYTPTAYYTGRDTFVVKATNNSVNTFVTIYATVNEKPRFNISPQFTSICNGGSAYIRVVGSGKPGGGVSILKQDFNTSLAPWTVDNTGAHGVPYPSGEWKIAVDGHLDFFGPYHAPDSSGFAVVTSIVSPPVSGTVVKSKLISPSFSTVGYENAELQFDHSYFDNVDTNANVDVSVDGGATWTTLINYHDVTLAMHGVFIGMYNNFKATSVSLAAYAGYPNVKVRFYYNSPAGFQWSLDNINIVGYPTGMNATVWTPAAHLYTDNGLSTSYVAGGYDDTIYVHPTTITTPTNLKYYITQAIGGCSTTDSITISVTPSPAISGNGAVCVGANDTLTVTVPYGTWSTTNGNTSVSYDGIVRGLSPGVDTLRYLTYGSCATTVTKTVTVSTTPSSVGGITGGNTVCAGTTISLSNSAGGGTWSSDATTIATVSSTGVVTGVTVGTTIISYAVVNGCGTAVATTTITVTPPAVINVITGAGDVCAGASITMSTTGTGGVWSSSNTAAATVSSGGTVSGISSGTATISYSTSGVCNAAAIKAVTVNPMPVAGTITGVTTMCAGATTTLSNATTGGVWSSVNTAIATVNSAGMVLGVAGGTATIGYSTINSCGSAVTIATVTVNPLPIAGAITGTAPLCAGSIISLSNATPGGTWSSSNTSVAAVNSAGAASGIAPGTASISYTVSNGCGTVRAIATVSVNPLPLVSVITGTKALCVGAAATLNNVTTGGIWSSDNTATAPISSTGIVNGVTAGTATISYSVTNACGITAATATVTVSAAAVAGVITGTTSVCAGASIILSNTTPGGTWSSSATMTASVTGSGVVAGVAAGTARISYTITNGCGSAMATAVVTVNPLPVAGIITGGKTLCVGTTTMLSNTIAGGAWSSGATSIATVSSAGLVNGVSAGVAFISYSVTNGCGTTSAIAAVTVNALPNAGVIIGATNVCAGAAILLSNAVTGGSWTSGTPAIATVTSTGYVTGISAGTATISYTVINSCGTTFTTATVTVKLLPVSGIITGGGSVCEGASIMLSNATTGGLWGSSNTGVATVSSGGVMAGVMAGAATISYAVSNSCGTSVATHAILVQPLPVAGTITGATVICKGSSAVMSNAVSGGVWSSSNTNIIVTAGAVNATVAGTSTISYAVTTVCGVAVATLDVTINSLPYAGKITGKDTICESETVSLLADVSGGAWSTGDGAIAIVSATGVMTGVAAGLTSAGYTVVNSCGADVAVFPVLVKPLSYCSTGIRNVSPMTELRVYPNPNAGDFSVVLSSAVNEDMRVVVSNVLGEQVRVLQATTNASFDISLDTAPGIYLISVTTRNGRWDKKVVITK